MIRFIFGFIALLFFTACSSQGVSLFQSEISQNGSSIINSDEYSVLQNTSNNTKSLKTGNNPDLPQKQLLPPTRPAKQLDFEKTVSEKADTDSNNSLLKPVVKIDRKKDHQRITQPLKPSTDSKTEMSLLIKKDDIEEDEISSLFTSDYIRDFDIPIVFNDAVQYFVRYFSTEKRKVLSNWLRRSRRYAPMIKTILREHGLPEDLIYLAMIESGFNPKAYSSMKACGPWQFISETGGRYGLKVNHWVDERRDPEKSTVAAAQYLKDLFNQFGNWYLAAAGYNAGEKRIERAIEKHETTDFWEISKFNTLPRETRDYIPRLLAAAIIAKDPEKFGFINIDYDESIRTISEKVPGGISLLTIARAATTDLSIIRQLNPEILTMITPPDNEKYVIRLPESVRKERFRENLENALVNEKKISTVNTYILKKKDTLPDILKRYRVTQGDLALVNSCDEPILAKQGRVIYIPSFQIVRDREVAKNLKVTKNKPPLKQLKLTSYKSSKTESTQKPVTRAIYHRVKKGETLSAIADMYNTSTENIKLQNKFKKDMIRSGMKLKISSAEYTLIPAKRG